jgi:predicted dehydrogenase
MSSKAIPVLVVGTGFGCRIQIHALRAANFEVVGLVGADMARTKERAAVNEVPQAFVDLDQAISKTGAKAVAIATPPYTHASLTLAAIARGCHVLCEKPFARDAKEAKAMYDAAEKAGVAHLVGHEFRWAPERALGAQLIADGKIGTPKFVSMTQFIPYLVNPLDMPNWWFDEAEGGGWLGAAGSHVVDWVRSWLGDFESLSASLQVVSARQSGAEDTYTFRFRMTNGTEGVIQQTAAAWGPPVDIVRVAGTDGTVWTEGTAVWLADKDGAREVAHPADLALPPLPYVSPDPRQQTVKWQRLTQIELPPYVRLCEYWRALIDGKTPPNTVRPSTFADGLACMDVLDAVRESAAKGGALVKMPVRKK